jgi:Tol biopolymer transport system component
LAGSALAAALLGGAGLASACLPRASAQTSVRVERIAASTDRPTGNLYRAYGPSISADGQVVAFWSNSGSLVEGDTNTANDVFVIDRGSGAVQRLSVGAGGVQGGAPSQNAFVSRDGRFVAFESRATNLVPGDTNATNDIFVADRAAGTIERVSTALDGTQSNGASFRPTLSPDGRLVQFWSEASNLVPDDINGTYDSGGYDVFVKDRQTGAISRASLNAAGIEGVADSVTGSMTADGRLVAFGSYSGDLLPDDLNGVPDIYVKDLQTGALEAVSRAADGSEADGDSFWNPVISADGRYVAFWSEATNLVAGDTNSLIDIFVKDRQSGAVERLSAAADGAQANGPSYNPSLSDDGLVVAFWSEASNLVAGDTNNVADVFVKDRRSGTLERISVGGDGGQANAASYNPTVSADGSFVAYWSEATNLVGGDSNGKIDVFVVQR